jgi:competence protein ComEC
LKHLMRAIAALALWGCGTPTAVLPAQQAGTTEIHFLAVGQGDAVLIRAPDGRAVLYDGGTGSPSILPALQALDIRLELVIASHNHADHIGGLAEVIAAYQPRYVMENGVPHTTRAYENFLRAAANAGSQLLAPENRSITLGDARLRVVPPPGRPEWGHNDNSIGLVIEIGSFRATLLGDSEHRQQAWWLENHRNLLGPVDIHKATHHGSANGDTRALLEILRPSVVIVSAGAGNSYGHPHASALALYQGVGARVLRTDRDGSVIIRVKVDGTHTVTTSGQR